MVFFMFLNYILLIMLLQLSWFFPFCPPPPSTPYSFKQSTCHCSCPWVMCMFFGCSISLLYFTSPWLFCNYLFVLLDPLTFSPIPHISSLLSGNHQNAFSFHDPVSILLVCSVCFLDSIVERYVFFAFYFSQFWSSTFS